MTRIINNRLSVQHRLKWIQRTGGLFLILSVLVIGYLSLMNVQQGFREYRRLSQETMPVIAVLEGLRFSSIRIVASVSELGMVTQLKAVEGAKRNAAMAQEERYMELGFDQFNLELARYRELVLRYFPLEVPEAERLFHEGSLLRHQAQKLQAAIQQGAGPQELFQQKEAMEQNEARFLKLATAILEYEAAEVGERDEVITNALERQIWVLWLGGLCLIGLAAFQWRLRVHLCLSCPGGEVKAT